MNSCSYVFTEEGAARLRELRKRLNEEMETFQKFMDNWEKEVAEKKNQPKQK